VGLASFVNTKKDGFTIFLKGFSIRNKSLLIGISRMEFLVLGVSKINSVLRVPSSITYIRWMVLLTLITPLSVSISSQVKAHISPIRIPALKHIYTPKFLNVKCY